MLYEHAITYKDRLSIADVEYMIKKSNKHGRLGHEIIRVHEETDCEGTHIYFDVIGITNEQRRNSEEV